MRVWESPFVCHWQQCQESLDFQVPADLGCLLPRQGPESFIPDADTWALADINFYQHRGLSEGQQTS